MSPIFGVPLLIVIAAVITWVPVSIGADLARDYGSGWYSVAGAAASLLLWGVGIGLVMANS